MKGCGRISRAIRLNGHYLMVLVVTDFCNLNLLIFEVTILFRIRRSLAIAYLSWL